jgi:hypothetical protein
LIKSKLAVLAIISVALGLTGCVGSSVMPFSANTVQITTSGDKNCSDAGVQKVAMTDAAITTIKNGFDSFMIVSGQNQDTSGVGGPVDQSIVVRMFHSGDQGASTAISAQAFLGTNWQAKVASGFPSSCL